MVQCIFQTLFTKIQYQYPTRFSNDSFLENQLVKVKPIFLLRHKDQGSGTTNKINNSLQIEYNNNLFAQSLKDTYKEYTSGMVPTIELIKVTFTELSLLFCPKILRNFQLN